METNKHTPGPWTVDGSYIISPTLCIANVGQHEANAKLIAAAPEVLDLLCHALVYVEDQLDCPTNKPGTVRTLSKQIRAAIAKAEGKA